MSPDEVPDRRPVALVTAASVAVAVVALVLLFGVSRPPALPSVADGGTVPPSRVAWLSYEDEGRCLTVVELDGRTRRPWCSDDGVELVAWDRRGVVVRTYGTSGADLELTVDPDTGEVRSSGPSSWPPDTSLPPDEVTTSRPAGGEELEVRAADGTVLWRTAAPDAYEVHGGWPDPSGEVLLLVDAVDRLLVVDADGAAPPRVWAEDVDAYGDVVWEGSAQR